VDKIPFSYVTFDKVKIRFYLFFGFFKIKVKDSVGSGNLGWYKGG